MKSTLLVGSLLLFFLLFCWYKYALAFICVLLGNRDMPSQIWFPRPSHSLTYLSASDSSHIKSTFMYMLYRGTSAPTVCSITTFARSHLCKWILGSRISWLRICMLYLASSSLVLSILSQQRKGGLVGFFVGLVWWWWWFCFMFCFGFYLVWGLFGFVLCVCDFAVHFSVLGWKIEDIRGKSLPFPRHSLRSLPDSEYRDP